ncbi:CPBP family intramembrane glutamic endopeptidase [Christiangramia salexigens]|uniref:CAAX protease family protein n=1 Tax=Christiangramia salexigens TaxID=1913577 RepID=A0A1L3J431_9FLAO|nr:CPBP family intramembrane glutamic endopeptidase [Christiangramia salexigens]APG59887.1 CAAX protease family protein [Christiangramia salexigens]
MLGILVLLILSWGLLYLLEKQDLSILGFKPVNKRLRQFGYGFMISLILAIIFQLLDISLKSLDWSLNPSIQAVTILKMFWWDLISVLTEELIFRGAMLYILIKRFGANTAMIISAIAFGIFHWFSFGILGQIMPMIVVLIGTGLMGYAWALAFCKTRSIFLAFGLHLGWNFTMNTIFSRGPLGDGLFTFSGGNMISDWYSLIGLWLGPLIIFIIIKYFVKPEKYALGNNNTMRPEGVKTSPSGKA